MIKTHGKPTKTNTNGLCTTYLCDTQHRIRPHEGDVDLKIDLFVQVYYPTLTVSGPGRRDERLFVVGACAALLGIEINTCLVLTVTHKINAN